MSSTVEVNLKFSLISILLGAPDTPVKFKDKFTAACDAFLELGTYPIPSARDTTELLS